MLPLVLEVEVVFTQLEVVTRNLPLVVEELLGTSNAPDARAWNLPTSLRPRSVVWASCLVWAQGLAYGELLHYPQVPGPASKGDTQGAPS